MKQKAKEIMAAVLIIMTCMSFLPGCGKASDTEEPNEETSVTKEQDEEMPDTEEQGEGMSVTKEQDEKIPDTEESGEDTSDTENQSIDVTVTCDGMGELISDEDAADLQYMQKYMLEDIYGDGSSYEVYAPDGSENSDGFLSYFGHGISFFAAVYSGGDENLPYEMLNESLKSQKADWGNNEEYSDVQLGKVVKNGADRYVTASVKSKDLYGTAYEKRMLFYLDVPKTGVGVLWQLEIAEVSVDEQTEKILAQMGQCYGTRLENLMPSGEWAKADAVRQVEEQDIYEPEEGEKALIKVDGYQYLGKTTLYFADGKTQCPVMAPMGRATSVRESSLSASMHGVHVYIGGSPTGTDQYVPLMKKSADRLYEQKLNEESVENRNVRKSEVMVMSGFENAWYYVVDYETFDPITEEHYKETEVNCWMVIEEKYALTCDITLRDKDFDTSTNTLLQELEMAYGIDLSGYYNEE